MSVPDIEPVKASTGDGLNKIFDFGYLINSESEILVQHTNKVGFQTTLILNTDYSVHGVGNPNGGYIIFPLDTSVYSIASSTEKITRSLDLPFMQEVDYNKSGGLNLVALENSFDYLTRMAQILKRKIERCIKVGEGSSMTADELIESLQQAQENSNNSAIKATEQAQIATEKAEQATQAAASLSNATEASAGIASIATQDEALAGVDDTKIMTPVKTKMAIKKIIAETLVPNTINSADSVDVLGYEGLEISAIATKSTSTSGKSHDNPAMSLEIVPNNATNAIIYDYSNDAQLQQVPAVIEGAYLPDVDGVSEGACFFCNDPTNNFGKQKQDGAWVDKEFCKVGQISTSSGAITGISTYSFNTNGYDFHDGGAGIPSDRYIDLELKVSGSTYIAPSNGWYAIGKKTGVSDRYMALRNECSSISTQNSSTNAVFQNELYLPAKRGDIVRVLYDLTGITIYFRFIYAEGASK